MSRRFVSPTHTRQATPHTHRKMAANQEQDKLARTQQQADEVTGIMRNNIEQARDRDLKLQGIEVKAERLQDQANRFKTQAKDLHFKMMCANGTCDGY